MSDKLTCGHPKGCVQIEEDGAGPCIALCGWCEEVAHLRESNKAIQECVGKTNLTLEAGDYTLSNIDEIGMLVVLAGNVTINPEKEPTPIITLDQQDWFVKKLAKESQDG